MLQVVTNGTQAEYQGLESGGNKEEEDPQKVFYMDSETALVLDL